jgi:hypothetical protein
MSLPGGNHVPLVKLTGCDVRFTPKADIGW